MLKDVEFIIKDLYKISPDNNTGYTVLFFFYKGKCWYSDRTNGQQVNSSQMKIFIHVFPSVIISFLVTSFLTLFVAIKHNNAGTLYHCI
jgi:hypothetical protein